MEELTPLIQHLIQLFQSKQQATTESESLLKLVYQMLHQKYSDEGHMPDGIRQEKTENDISHKALKDEYVKFLITQVESQNQRSISPEANIKATRKIY